MRVNLGCGYNKVEGYVNVDHDVHCNPDVIADLEDTLPFEDSSVDEIILNHVLEHLGQDTKTYFTIWKEFYRVLKDQGEIRITIPHHLHENFHHDPTHVRKVTPTGVDMFNQQRNQRQIDTGGQETTLGIQLGIDVRVQGVGYDLTPDAQKELEGQSFEVIDREVNKRNNICFQTHILAKVFKCN